MSKEELKKEAEKNILNLKNNSIKVSGKTFQINEGDYTQGYLDGAEPREKRIEELEATNKRISDECHKLVDSLEKKQIQIDAEQIRALQKQNGELTDRVRELERQIEKMKCCYNCSKWYDGECEESPKSKTFFCADFKCDKWEIYK